MIFCDYCQELYWKIWKIIFSKFSLIIRDRRERSRQDFPRSKSCLKTHRNALSREVPDFSPVTDQFLGFPWFSNTYLPIGKACGERSRRSLQIMIFGIFFFEIKKIEKNNFGSKMKVLRFPESTLFITEI